jgi:photosystem II stability/assembly factor-like uncharacterized protein
VDGEHGWALGLAPAGAADFDPFDPPRWVVIYSTVDGGDTWQQQPSPDAQRAGPDTPPGTRAVNEIHFSDLEQGEVTGTWHYVTADGGHTWQDAGPMDPATAPIALAAGQFRLERGACRPVEGSLLQDCTFTLAQAGPGQGWSPTAIQFESVDLPEVPPEFVAGNADTAWIFFDRAAFAADGPPAPLGRALRTTDGGATWHALPDFPMAPWGEGVFAWLRAVDAQTLWLAAGNAGAGAFGGKAVYVSTDGGQSWELRARVDIDGSNPMGEITPQGHLGSFTAVSAERAFWGLNRGPLLGTFDGGRTWREVLPYPLAAPGDGAAGPIVFADEQHGWVVTQDAIYRTTDGGETWQRGDLPGSVLPTPAP